MESLMQLLKEKEAYVGRYIGDYNKPVGYGKDLKKLQSQISSKAKKVILKIAKTVNPNLQWDSVGCYAARGSVGSEEYLVQFDCKINPTAITMYKEDSIGYNITELPIPLSVFQTIHNILHGIEEKHYLTLHSLDEDVVGTVVVFSTEDYNQLTSDWKKYCGMEDDPDLGEFQTYTEVVFEHLSIDFYQP